MRRSTDLTYLSNKCQVAVANKHRPLINAGDFEALVVINAPMSPINAGVKK